MHWIDLLSDDYFCVVPVFRARNYDLVEIVELLARQDACACVLLESRSAVLFYLTR